MGDRSEYLVRTDKTGTHLVVGSAQFEYTVEKPYSPPVYTGTDAGAAWRLFEALRDGPLGAVITRREIGPVELAVRHQEGLMFGRILRDLAEMPDFNPSTQQGRGDWGLHCVSDGSVTMAPDGKPSCVDHQAMNAVNPDRTLWRCLMCGRGCYAEQESELV